MEFLKNELGRRLVQVAARCVVDYKGRAQSTLPSGDRLLMFKPDGTLLIHTATKLKPVNWQPPGCVFSAGRENGALVVTATREKPKETVRILLEEVHAVLSIHLEDGGAELDLVGTEHDLQAFLADHPEIVEPGFRFWRRERSSGVGPMDLYGEDAQGRRVVVETKRRAAGVKEADQLRRYVEKERKARGVVVRGILLAPAVSEKARLCLTEWDLEWKELDWEKLRRVAADLRAASQRALWEF